MAHVALRTICFERPGLFFGVMVSPEVGEFLADVLRSVEGQAKDKADFTAEDLRVHPLRAGEHPLLVVEFPEPRTATEAYFIGALLKIGPGQNPDEADVSYFTLERGDAVADAGRCQLQVWHRDGTHTRLASPVTAGLEQFVTAVSEHADV